MLYPYWAKYFRALDPTAEPDELLYLATSPLVEAVRRNSALPLWALADPSFYRRLLSVISHSRKGLQGSYSRLGRTARTRLYRAFRRRWERVAKRNRLACRADYMERGHHSRKAMFPRRWKRRNKQGRHHGARMSPRGYWENRTRERKRERRAEERRLGPAAKLLRQYEIMPIGEEDQHEDQDLGVALSLATLAEGRQVLVLPVVLSGDGSDLAGERLPRLSEEERDPPDISTGTILLGLSLASLFWLLFCLSPTGL